MHIMGDLDNKRYLIGAAILECISLPRTPITTLTFYKTSSSRSHLNVHAIHHPLFMTTYEPIPNVIIDLKLWLIGTIHATLSYGVVLTLTVAYLHHFLQYKSLRSPSSNDEGVRQQRLFFPLYTMAMFCISTFAFVVGTLDTTNLLFSSSKGVHSTQYRFCRFGEAIAMVLASWGNDVLMVSRNNPTNR